LGPPAGCEEGVVVLRTVPLAPHSLVRTNSRCALFLAGKGSEIRGMAIDTAKVLPAETERADGISLAGRRRRIPPVKRDGPA
jgi:hypothetical protein